MYVNWLDLIKVNGSVLVLIQSDMLLDVGFLPTPLTPLISFHAGHFSGWSASTGFREAGRLQFGRSRSIISSNCYPTGHPGDSWAEGGHSGSGQHWLHDTVQDFIAASALPDTDGSIL